jgi:glycopeptide antibiotics resistance protein
LMVFWGIGFLFVKMSTGKVMAAALLLSYAIEFSQLYQADWINALRHTTLGGLVLGFGFLWSDLVCYTAGVLAGGLMEYTAAPFFFRSIVCLRRGKGRRE